MFYFENNILAEASCCWQKLMHYHICNVIFWPVILLFTQDGACCSVDGGLKLCYIFHICVGDRWTEIKKYAALPCLGFIVTNHIFIFCVCLTRFCLYSLPHYIIFSLVVFVSFSIFPLLFPSSPLFRLHTFHIPSLPLSYQSFFPLELSLHTIANNLVKESHLCSHAFSINSPFVVPLLAAGLFFRFWPC